MKLLLTLLFLVSALNIPAHSQTSSSISTSPQRDFMKSNSNLLSKTYSLLNINNMSNWTFSNGVGSASPMGHPWGLMFPRGTSGLVTADGLLWVGKVIDDQPNVIRTGGNLWLSSNRPGIIASKGVAENSNDASVRVYRVRRDFRDANLTGDAIEYFGDSSQRVSVAEVEEIKAQYVQDWAEWPWQKGAPFFDENNNGVMDESDYPDMLGADQVVWYAYNDLTGSFGAEAIGLEVQVTMWAHRGIKEFEDNVFKRYRVIYKGTSVTPANARVDSMYLGIWADTDVGNYWDDLAGCDSLRNMAFAYNSVTPDGAFKPFSNLAYSVAYQLLQGPIVAGQSDDSALFGLQYRLGYRNLPLTSVLIKPTPSFIPEPGLNEYTLYWWKAFRGYVPVGTTDNPWLDPNGAPTKFPLGGDPFQKTGWLDGTPTSGGTFSFPGGRRFSLSAGPFTLSLGDTQEVVIAIIGGIGYDGPSSVQSLKFHATVLSGSYPFVDGRTDSQRFAEVIKPFAPPTDFALKQNYPNPFNSFTQIEFTIPIDAPVQLSVFDVLGREVIVLEDASFRLGRYRSRWNGRDKDGKIVPSGIYFFRLVAGHIYLTRRMLLVR
ncbi:MAG: T9SS type A sorting domain-containing protein [Ignavibacteriales bacterium]|nr:T9SS type A sorting domain-containing protein [Ignavibacteriales bacterium]